MKSVNFLIINSAIKNCIWNKFLIKKSFNQIIISNSK